MDKNTIIGFLLMALVLIGFSWYSRPSEEQVKQQQEQQEKKAQLEQEKSTTEESQKAEEKKQDEKIAALQAQAKDVVLQNNKVKLTFSTLGGTLKEAEIINYKDRQRKENVRLFDATTAQMRLKLDGKDKNIITDEHIFMPVDKTDSTVTMRLAEGAGSLEITYKLHKDCYMLDMTVQAHGMSDFFPSSMNHIGIEWTDAVRPQEKGYDFENRYASLTYHDVEGSTDNLSEGSKDDMRIEEPLDWIAFKNQFFSAVLISPIHEFTEGELHSYPFRPENEDAPRAEREQFLKTYVAKLQTAFDPTGKEPTRLQLYLGPNDYHLLKQHNELCINSDKDLELEDLVYLGWPLFKWINRFFIIYIFDWLSALGLHMGLVLLLLTIIVKILVYPTTKKSYLSSARMRVLKPKVDALNAKYPNREDAMKKQQEMMQLYSQYGVSPMGGCLPMLLQMPIWIALFNFVPNAIELRGQSFLWADDLSAYDDIINWGTDLWLIGDHLSIFCLLFCATNIINSWISMRQQSNTMSTEQAQQMKMMRWMMYLMPIMFFFMFNTYSSGLNYYYFLSGITSILIMWYLRKTTDDTKLLEQLEAYKAKHANDPKKKSGMAARLEALQKQAEMMEEQRRRQQKK